MEVHRPSSDLHVFQESFIGPGVDLLVGDVRNVAGNPVLDLGAGPAEVDGQPLAQVPFPGICSPEFRYHDVRRQSHCNQRPEDYLFLFHCIVDSGNMKILSCVRFELDFQR